MPLLLKSSPPCPCFAVLPITVLVLATEATELTAVILQYVLDHVCPPTLEPRSIFFFLSLQIDNCQSLVEVEHSCQVLV